MVTRLKTCIKCGVEKPAESFSPEPRMKDGRCSHCKECRAEHARLYRKTNPEAVARNRRRYDQTDAGIKAERKRLYCHTHREEIAERKRLYYQANREAIAERQRLHQQNNRDLYCAYNRNRRARQQNASGSHTAADVAAQRSRQKGKCYWCGKKVGDDYHVDHVVPLSKGGSNGPENIVIACAACNLSKGAKHPIEFAGVLC